MNRHSFASLSAILIFAVGCRASDNSIPEATPQTFFGGPENLQLVKEATSITAFRIVDPQQQHAPRKPMTIDGRQCDASSAVVAGPEVAQVVAALSDMTNFGDMYMCDFDPGVILRFAAGKHTLDLIVCFHCGEMVLYGDGVEIRRPYNWARTRNSFRKDARRAFTAIAKKAFPNDVEIQALRQ